MHMLCRQCLHKTDTNKQARQTTSLVISMKHLITWFFSPLVFGLAFIAPLSAQILDRVDITLPIANIWVGLMIGLGLGLMAQTRGSWLWIKI